MKTVNKFMFEEGGTVEQALQMFGEISFHNVTNSLWFYGPIFIGIASVMFYIFLIWYRDWFGKNTFIYRLLMLPTERVNIYLAKLTIILFMTWSFVSVQLIALLLEMNIFKMLVADEFRVDITMRDALLMNIETGILFPRTFLEFLLSYGTGIMFVAIVFTAILFERSYRMKGIVLGLVYVALATAVFISPVLLQALVLNDYFYADELVYLMSVTGLAALALSIAVSAFLLKFKIRV